MCIIKREKRKRRILNEVGGKNTYTIFTIHRFEFLTNNLKLQIDGRTDTYSISLKTNEKLQIKYQRVITINSI